MRGYLETLRMPDVALQPRIERYLDTIEHETHRLNES